VNIWFARGDVVRVMDDMAEVTKLQQGHGEWNEHMAMVNHFITWLLYIFCTLTLYIVQEMIVVAQNDLHYLLVSNMIVFDFSLSVHLCFRPNRQWVS